jgi:hypothetical protein
MLTLSHQPADLSLVMQNSLFEILVFDAIILQA